MFKALSMKEAFDAFLQGDQRLHCRKEGESWRQALLLADQFSLGVEYALELPDEPAGEWEYCEVTQETDNYGVLCWAFRRSVTGVKRWGIEYAPGMVGFGGVEDAENPDVWQMQIGRFIDSEFGTVERCAATCEETLRPTTPRRVRFLRAANRK